MNRHIIICAIGIALLTSSILLIYNGIKSLDKGCQQYQTLCRTELTDSDDICIIRYIDSEHNCSSGESFWLAVCDNEKPVRCFTRRYSHDKANKCPQIRCHNIGFLAMLFIGGFLLIGTVIYWLVFFRFYSKNYLPKLLEII